MDKKFIPFLFVFVLLSASLVNADTMYHINAFNDTWVTSNDSTMHGFEPTINLTRGESLFKFNISNVTNHLFTIITFRLDPLIGFCNAVGGCYFEVKYLNNNSWNESTNGLTRPDGTRTIISAIALSTISGNKDSLNFMGLDTPWLGGATRSVINQTQAIYGFYGNDTLTLFINGTTFYSLGASAGTNPNGTIYSVNSIFINNYPLLNVTVTDFLNGSKTNTDLNSFTELDFETGNNLTAQSVIGMDLLYIPSTNELLPVSESGVTLAFAPSSATNDNDLATRINDCYTISSYNTNAHNPNVDGRYWYICVNLSAQHQGKSFFGIIKVLNNTDVRGNTSLEFDYLYAVASPKYVSFTAPTYSPSPPQIGINLTIQTTTSITMHNGLMYFRYNVSSGFSPLGTVGVETGSTYTGVHTFILNNQYLTSASNFEIYFIADDGTQNYTSATFTFNVSRPFTNVVNGSALPNALTGLVNTGIVPDYNSALALFSAFIIIGGTAISFYYAGAIVSIITVVALITVLSLMGFLPYYLMIPVLVIASAIVVSWVRGVFRSEN